MTRQNALPLVWPDRYHHDNYIVADCNAQAWQTVKEPEKWLSPVQLLIGEKGSGKTHLAAIFRQIHTASVIDDPAMVQTALQQQQPMVLDNADHFLDRGGSEAAETLFHLLNHAINNRIPFLLSATHPPQYWAGLPDVLSRLQAAPHIILQPPDEEMLKAAYRKLFGDRGILVDERVLDYIALRSERSFSGIRQIVDRLDKASLEQGRKITIPLINKLDLFNQDIEK